MASLFYTLNMNFKSFLLISSTLISLTSCQFFMERSSEEIFDEMIKKFNYDEIYIKSVERSENNFLAPENHRNNPYGFVYCVYGSIDNEDNLYVYGEADYGKIFEPYILDWPLKHSYDECLSLYSKNIEGKAFNKTVSDNISFETNLKTIEKLFDDGNYPDNNFLLKYNKNNYVYEVDGELQYTVI